MIPRPRWATRYRIAIQAAACGVAIGVAGAAEPPATAPQPPITQTTVQPTIDWWAELTRISTQRPDAATVQQLLRHIDSAGAVQRESLIRVLLTQGDTAAAPTVEVFADGSLASRLVAMELLEAWSAPLGEMDPWDPQTLTPQRLSALREWASSPAHIASAAAVASAATRPSQNVVSVASELSRMIAAEDAQEALAIRERLARFGPAILSDVIAAAREQEGDVAQERLAALRYRLVCSEALVNGWPGGIDRLASRDSQVRRKAAQELAARTKAADLALLRQLFSDSDPLVREISLAAIQGIGADAARDALLTMLQDADPNVRAAVLKQLAEKPDATFVTRLVEYAKTESDPDLVLHAVRALRATKGPAVAKGLIPILSHPNWQVRAEAAEAAKECMDGLGEEQKADLYAAMVSLLDDTDAFVVSRALQCLQSADIAAALDPMLKVAQRRPELAGEVVKALSTGSNMRRLAVPHLRAFCKHADPAVRAAALLGLCQIATDSVQEEVTQALKDPDARVRTAGAKALYGLIEDLRPFAPYTRLTPRSQYSSRDRQSISPDAWVKKFQAGQNRPEWMIQAGELCRQMLSDDDAERRIYAAMPLAALSHDAAATDAIIKALQQQPQTARMAAHLLIWLPAADRVRVSEQMLSLAAEPDRQAEIIEIMAIHSDPASTERLWTLLGRPDAKDELATAIYGALRSSYLGEEYYNAQRLSSLERKRIAGELRPRAEKGPELQRTVAMAILLPVDPAAAADVAKTVRADSAAGEWSHLDAAQIQLLALPEDQAMAEAIAMMSAPEKAMRKAALPYLVGMDGRLERLRGSIYISYSKPDRMRIGDDGKPLLPVYPKGLDAAVLTGIRDSGDEEQRPMAAYLLALQKDRRSLDQLIAYWRGHNDQQWRDLTYRAIAVFNDDSLTPVLEEIYRGFESRDYYIRQFYWTIRGIEGPNVLKLRKQIRQDVGMDRLR